MPVVIVIFFLLVLLVYLFLLLFFIILAILQGKERVWLIWGLSFLRGKGEVGYGFSTCRKRGGWVGLGFSYLVFLFVLFFL